MTSVQPGLSVRDSQILELLRGGAPVQRVIDIGRHRKAWNEVHVGAVVAYHLTRKPGHMLPDAAQPAPPPPVDPPRPQRGPAVCGTISGERRHRKADEPVCGRCRKAANDYKKAWAAAKRPPVVVPLEKRVVVWEPEPFTGRATTVRLSPGRIAVLDGLCRGLSNRRIGEELGRSEDTVKTQVKDILAALGATDRMHAVVRVMSGQVRIVREQRRAAG
jgi:DNA-binding CsgD family transcriptional regulator